MMWFFWRKGDGHFWDFWSIMSGHNSAHLPSSKQTGFLSQPIPREWEFSIYFFLRRFTPAPSSKFSLLFTQQTPEVSISETLRRPAPL